LVLETLTLVLYKYIKCIYKVHKRRDSASCSIPPQNCRDISSTNRTANSYCIQKKCLSWLCEVKSPDG